MKLALTIYLLFLLLSISHNLQAQNGEKSGVIKIRRPRTAEVLEISRVYVSKESSVPFNEQIILSPEDFNGPLAAKFIPEYKSKLRYMIRYFETNLSCYENMKRELPDTIFLMIGYTYYDVNKEVIPDISTNVSRDDTLKMYLFSFVEPHVRYFDTSSYRGYYRIVFKVRLFSPDPMEIRPK